MYLCNTLYHLRAICPLNWRWPHLNLHLYIYDQAFIKHIYDQAFIKHIYDQAFVKQIYDQAFIKQIYDQACTFIIIITCFGVK